MRIINELIYSLFVLILLVVVTACVRPKRPLLEAGGLPALEPPAGSNPFQPEFREDVFDLGSAFGDLGPAENSGLQNAFDAMDQVNAEFETPIPEDIAEDITDLLGGESSTGDPDKDLQLKLALIGQLMQYCTQQVMSLAPQPGEPLLGKWGADCEVTKTQKPIPPARRTPGLLDQVFGLVRDVLFGRQEQQQNNEPEEKKSSVSYDFTVSGEHEGQLSHHSGRSMMQTQNAGFSNPLPTGSAEFRISGRELNASLGISPSGVGTITRSDASWRGELRDTPHAGNGVLTQLKNIPRGTELKKCTANLAHSDNPIPRKFQEAVKKLGGCLRPAAILFSPAIDKMFENMDPGLRHLILQGMLGIKQ